MLLHFLRILFGNLLKRPFRAPGSPPVSPAQAALALFAVHMIAEGYVFAAGSGLSAVFWAVIGGAHAYRNLPNGGK